MVYNWKYNNDVKRLRTFIDRTDDIQLYTNTNLYPQIAESIRDRSYTISGCCEALANFLGGEGFEDENIGNMVVNSKGDTMNDILDKIKIDAATFSGSFVVHLGVNMLGEFNNLSVWPLSHWRLGLPSEDGDVYDVKYNSNWEQDPYKEITNARRIIEYPKFNADKDVILEQIEEWGLEYPGMVFYVSPLEDQYPKATFDPVMDQGQTQEEIGLFRLKSIQNGLNAGSIFVYPGKIEDEKKEQQIKDRLNSHTGAEGANSIIVVESDGSNPTSAKDLIVPLTVADHDKVHEFISRDDKEAIIETFKMPKGILGVNPEGGLFNQQDLQDQYTYYNMETRPKRSKISRAFKKIFANWHQPVESDFKIKELQYGTVKMPVVNA